MVEIKPEVNNRRATDKQFTLLCIDDETANLKVLALIFKENYKVVVCKQAKQGLKIALDILPDLILLDVVMPECSGFELIQQLKKEPSIKHIPVIFITGLQSAEDEQKGLNLGACDYIQKPFNSGIVRARVNTHLEIIRQRQLLERFAHFDSLTEVPNRRKWQIDSESQWIFAREHQEPLVLGIIDIDFFKRYNDSYGHQQGDIVLRKVANSIRRVLFDVGGEIYRCGGEEFYFYIPVVKGTRVEAVLADCSDAVSAMGIQHMSSEASTILTVSIGAIQVLPQAKYNIEQVIAQADDKLYSVKQSTRNAVHFEHFVDVNESGTSQLIRV